MLGSGAHIALGKFTDGAAASVDLELMLAEDVEPHYNHRFEQALTGRQEIAGEAGKYQTNPGRLFWSLTDWSGGEGVEVWTPQDPSVYLYSTGLNTRRKGQVTGRPDRLDLSSGIAEETTSARPAYLSMGGGILWFGAEETVAFSSDYGVSFTRIDNTAVDGVSGSGILAGDRLTAMAGDNRYIYFASSSTAGTTAEINRFEASGIASTTDATLVQTRGTIANAIVGMAIVQGRLYAWTGFKLFEYDLSPAAGAALPLDATPDEYRLVHNAGSSMDFTLIGRGNQYGNGVWYADCMATEQSVVYFVASDGVTDVFEYKVTGGRPAPIWRLPYGFTARCGVVQNGILFLAGQFGAANTGTDEYGGMYAMDLATRKVFFIGHFRKLQGSSLLMQDMANSWGSQIMMSDTKGKVFIYDMDTDGISLLDDLSNSTTNGAALSIAFGSDARISALHTVGNRRLAAYYDKASTTLNWGVVNWRNDELTNRENTGSLSHTLDSSEWDFDYPMETKGLLGFWVTFRVEDTATTSGLLANQRITVKYAKDGGSYATAGTIDSSSTPTGSKGRVFVQVAAADTAPTAPFIRLAVQLTLDNNATTGVKPPVVQGVTAEASMVSNVETWELVVKVDDEPRGMGGRPALRQWKGSSIRDYLEDLAQNKAAITFKDGYRYNVPGQSSTHTVVIEDVEDAIVIAGEGAMRIKLKAVAST